MKWKESTNGGPAYLEQEDFDNIIKSECMFARKFADLNTVSSFLRRLDGQKLCER